MKKTICIIALFGLAGGALLTGCKKAEAPAMPGVSATNATPETPSTNAAPEAAAPEIPSAEAPAVAPTNAFPNGWPGMEREHPPAATAPH